MSLVITDSNILQIEENSIKVCSNIITDDILLTGPVVGLILIYLEGIFQLCQKYKSSFKMSKYKFFTDEVKFVGHDIMRNGNSPALSKFNIVKSWKLPSTDQIISFLISFVKYYHKYLLYHKIYVKPLR